MTISKEAIEAAKAAYWTEAHNGGGYSDKCYEAALTAALPFLPIAGEGKAPPEGWHLVPKEPTVAMRMPWKTMRGDAWYNKYKAMLAAAPVPPSSPGKDGGQEEADELREKLSEAEAIIEERDDRMALVDRIADLIGLPQDQELDQVAFELWFSKTVGKDGGQEVEAEGHEEHTYARFNALFERGRAAGGFEGETQNLIRELTNAMRDAANWRAETKIALRLEQQMRIEAQAALADALADPQPASTALVERLTKALEPFADACFNDNGDITVNLSAAGAEDFIKAYFVHRSALSSSTSREGESR
ncbi:hypothetical protein N182_18345 [Sinorhizobium sp. GL2]|nr:hypothetical protein N182_18345 [Sinorhizobium sp. GL2]